MGRLNMVETLLASELLEDCRSPAVIEFLANHATMVQYGRGSIISGTDRWPDFHILVEGSVHVVHYAKSGREVRICEFTDGQAFGGFDLTGDSRIAVHTVAKTDSTAIRFANWSVFDAAHGDPDLGLDLLRGAASIVAHLARAVVEMTWNAPATASASNSSVKRGETWSTGRPASSNPRPRTPTSRPRSAHTGKR